jgi:signal peptide peptidase SppA
MNLFTQISGGASSQLIARDLGRALEDRSVHSIVLLIDSPGGTVDGTQDLARQVRAGLERKPIVTLADGTMASAAYWIGAAGAEVLISSDTTLVGSIGVVATHKDMSAAERAQGVKTTEIAAGKYKRIASQFEPLSEEGRATLQEQVDYLYSIFVDQVADLRGLPSEKVLKDMADGRVFIGQQAVAAGLVDGASTLPALIADLAAGRRGKKPGSSGAGVAPQATSSQPPKGNPMDLETLRKDHPALCEALLAEGRALGVTEGATAERARILAVEAQALPGHEKLIATLKADGKTTGPEAAACVLEAERAARAAHAGALATDRPNAAPASAEAPQGDEKATPDSNKVVAEARRLVADAKDKGTTLSFTDAVKQAEANLAA